MAQFLQPDNPQWGIPLPLPQDRAITHEPRAELIHEVNPAYLSYWNPDAFGRAFVFLGVVLLGLIPSSVLAFVSISGMLQKKAARPNEPLDGIYIGAIIFAVLLPILSSVFTYLSVRRPLRPPTYLSRTLRRVYGWHGKKNIDGGWMYID